jgi:hypothetical protein
MRNGADPSRAAAGVAAQGARPPQPRLRQGRLFRKYLLLILTLVSGALLVSGGISLYFSYQEQKTALGDLQHEKAIAAASRIEQYIRQIEQQLAYAALPQLDASDVELRRIEFLKLLRQVPEVTDIAQLDGDGREQVLVSRLGMDVMRSNRDRSDEPAFKLAKRGKPWIGPVYFRKETEPYMTIAVRSGSDSGPVTIADVNLKFIWDVVSRIKIGEKGKAYVVDSNGFLVADPDIGLVLRKTSMSQLPHVKDALDKRAQDEQADVSRDLAGTEVLTSNARWRSPAAWCARSARSPTARSASAKATSTRPSSCAPATSSRASPNGSTACPRSCGSRTRGSSARSRSARASSPTPSSSRRRSARSCASSRAPPPTCSRC